MALPASSLLATMVTTRVYRRTRGPILRLSDTGALLDLGTASLFAPYVSRGYGHFLNSNKNIVTGGGA
jgi:hypothetical protein